ncbi:MAG: LysE family transporter, partial [Verrucomicrobiota bacterium]
MNFGNPVAIFASSFIIALSGALMPGPLLAVTIRHTSRKGFVAAPLLVLGHAVLEGALLCLLLFGLTEWIKGEAAVIAIALVGSAMLLRMAAGMAREVGTLRLATEPGASVPSLGDPPSPGWLRPVIDGVVTSAS